MRVVCISLKDFTNGLATGGNVDYMQVGDEFTVKSTCTGYGLNNVPVACYDLVEFSHTDKVFDQRNFAPLSDLDETTLVNEEFEEKYCVPINK